MKRGIAFLYGLSAFTLIACIASVLFGACSSKSATGKSAIGVGMNASASLAELKSGIAAYAPNNAENGFDMYVFDTLKKELLRLLDPRGERIPLGAPAGDSGKVTDLVYDGQSDMLTWTYKNMGDYDLSGDVGVPDITPIAQNYLANPTDGQGDDVLERWIDGDSSGDVGISDITPIAQNYLATVVEYILLSSAVDTGGFTEIGRYTLEDAKSDLPGGVTCPVRFEVAPLPANALDYVAVQPVDGSGNQGEMSDPILVNLGEQPPTISGVSPTTAAPGEQVSFSLSVTGTLPMTFSWDFDTWGNPTTSTDSAPLVVVPDTTGDYNGSVTVTNAYGEDTFEFMLTVTDDGSPRIDRVRPTYGFAGDSLAVYADVKGNPPFTYDWDFGTGATTANATDANPTITLTNVPGVYAGTLSVSNGQGETSHEFSLVVNGIANRGDWWTFGHDAARTGASPFSGPQDNNVRWVANLGSSIMSSSVFGTNGVSYTSTFEGELIAFDKDGGELWSVPAGEGIYGTPAVGLDGSVYFGTIDGKFMSVKQDGQPGFDLELMEGAFVTTSALVRDDGVVIFTSDLNDVYAVDTEGTVLWRTVIGDPEASPEEITSPALGNNGLIYFGTTAGEVHALYPDGIEAWTFVTEGGYETGTIEAAPSVGDDGTIYVNSLDGNLYSLNPDGTEKWRYSFGENEWCETTPSIGPVGYIYTVDMSGNLHKINSSGTGSVIYSIASGFLAQSTPAIDADGVIYFGCLDGKLVAVNPNGSLEWSYYTGDAIFASPTIADDGAVYVANSSGVLTVFGEGGSGNPNALTDVDGGGDKAAGLACVIRIAPDGVPWIAYSWQNMSGEDTDTVELRLAHWDGDSWEIETVDSETWEYWLAEYLDFEFDADGNPCIVYSYLDNSGDPYVGELRGAFKEGTSWNLSVIDDQNIPGYDAQIEFDKSGNPCVSYTRNMADILVYGTFDGTNWNMNEIDTGLGSEIATFATLVLDGDDHPHIAYYDGTNLDQKYAAFDGTNWNIEVVDSTGDVGWDCGLILDGSENPFITYIDSTEYDWIMKCAHYNGTTWLVGNVTDEPAMGAISLARDADGYPHVIYSIGDGFTGDVIHSYFDGTAWNPASISTDLVYTSLNLAFDGSGALHAAVAKESFFGGTQLKYYKVQ